MCDRWFGRWPLLRPVSSADQSVTFGHSFTLINPPAVRVLAAVLKTTVYLLFFSADHPSFSFIFFPGPVSGHQGALISTGFIWERCWILKCDPPLIKGLCLTFHSLPLTSIWKSQHTTVLLHCFAHRVLIAQVLRWRAVGVRLLWDTRGRWKDNNDADDDDGI